MLDEDEVRGLLNAADIPPTQVALSNVVQQGRRTIVRRRVASAAGGVALSATLIAAVAVPLALRGEHHTPLLTSAAGTTPSAGPSTLVSSPTAPAAQAVVTCSVAAIQTGNGIPKDININVIDPSGRYMAGAQSSDTVWKSVLYTDGVPAVMQIPGRMQEVDGINAHGVVVGITTIGANGNEKVYRYANGTYTLLKVPMSGKWHPFDVGINASGEIVAQEEGAGTSGGGKGTANLLWRAGSDMAIRLPMPNGSGLTGITDNGDIVGGGVQYADGTVGDATVWDSSGRNGTRLAVADGDRAIADEATGNFVGGGTYPKDSGVDWDGASVWNVVTGEETVYSTAGPILHINGSGDAIDADGTVFLNGSTPILTPLKPGQDVRADLIANNGMVVGASGTTNVVWHC